MGREIELKLDLTEDAASRLCRWDGLPEREDVTRLRATYFDTPDARLASKGLSLRIRQSGRRRVQTIKGDGSSAAGLFARQEWERPVRSQSPVLDGDTPVQDALGDAISQIEPLFETDVERTRWLIQEGDVRVEMVIDRGVVRAGAREAPLCEVELELVDGAPAALFAIARRIDGEVPVRPGVLSKAERGYALRGPVAEAVKAEPVSVNASMTIREAFLTIAGACLRHYRRNEALLLIEYRERALHQARVAVRRMRSALTLFKPVLLEADVARFQRELRWLAGMLGEARDLDVLHGRLVPGAQAEIAEVRADSQARVRAWLDSARVRGLLLDIAEWLALGAGCSGAADAQVWDFAGSRLKKLHKRVARGGDGLKKLPPDKRHKVRKDAKKLRYGAEFFAGVYADKGARKVHGTYVKALAKLQDRLGDLNDLATAPALFARYHLADDTGLDIRSEETLLRKAGKAHDRFASASRFWR
ncbi:CYTH and CHAD domain-containing protein [Sphingobium lactosutens]|uniref:Ceramide glucosyltransferase n=1 Tax=Sphingobium lactosutens DS20 TaxID=1331060 RepID=T0J108_9SPHN|nr:CHAD domain-containing protein [Sphingobium lactosutens]EQB15644.1 hypothetical protein RLDS_10225 [Sphingobium lactosutens DS20]